MLRRPRGLSRASRGGHEARRPGATGLRRRDELLPARGSCGPDAPVAISLGPLLGSEGRSSHLPRHRGRLLSPHTATTMIPGTGIRPTPPLMANTNDGASKTSPISSPRSCRRSTQRSPATTVTCGAPWIEVDYALDTKAYATRNSTGPECTVTSAVPGWRGVMQTTASELSCTTT